ncbi:MAG: mechanosensitive ion channel family protein 6 [Proteobacteria bacterium]|nr:mechanosensitive ion channel family protein 6 [Pseudomonadota bacterium]
MIVNNDRRAVYHLRAPVPRGAGRHRLALMTRITTALAGALLATVATAQLLPAATTGETPAAGETAAPQAIRPEDIPARASASRIALESMRARLDVVARRDDGQLAYFDAALARLRQQPDFHEIERLPQPRIGPLSREVRFYQRELEAVQAQDIARATRLSEDAAELARMRALWANTLQQATDQRLAQPLVDEARRVLDQVNEVASALDAPLSGALAARDRASRIEAQLESISRKLNEAARRADQRLLSREVDPLWSRESYSLLPERDATAVLAHVQDQTAYARDFAAMRQSALEGFAILALVGYAVVAWLRRRPQWFAGVREAGVVARHLLDRPYASFTLILLTAALLASDFTPTILVDLLAAALFLVLLRLTPRRLVAGRKTVLVGLAALFVLDRARLLMPYESMAFRLDLLVVTLVLAAGIAYYALAARRGRVDVDSWLWLWTRFAPLPLALLAAALAANLLGNVSLADLLARGLLSSIFVSAMLFAAALILDNFIVLLTRSQPGQALRMVALRGDQIVRSMQRIIRLVAVAFWLLATLTVFRLWEPLASRVSQLLGTSWSLGQLEFTPGGVLTFVVGVFVAFYLARMIRFLLNEELLARVPWPTGAKSTTATLVYYGVLFAGLILAFSAAGVQTGQFALVLGAVGVGIGFGLQNVVNNFVSGLILMFERPVQPGDIIDVDSLQGRVVEIGLRATRVQTWEGAEVVVPNGTLLSGNLVNWTLSDKTRRVEVAVGVAYGSDLRRVLEILMDVAVAQPDALKDPAPVVLFMGFGTSSLDFVMRFWTRDAANAGVARSDAGVAVAEALAAAGIAIPFPQQDLHLRSVTPEAAAALKT